MRDPLGSLLALVVYSSLVGLAIEICTWKVGVPMLIGLIGVVYWSCDQVWKGQKRGDAVSSTPLLISILLMCLCDLSITLSAIYLPVAGKTLIVVLLSVIPTHCILLFGQWIKIKDHLRAVVAITAPLTLIGIISTGISFNFTSPSLVPAVVLLIHSAILLGIGLYGTKFIVCQQRRSLRVLAFSSL
ncbi:hypothetical protein PMAYCL1PPCAC_07913 [Pristionchus mayeri]|uniref:Uncharacterized protein n=1 Tax=Pristionchus mayeri TaxID=1317129 RepID=A0AAN4ZAS8_9BILA|nr:hypothetical protein PMAYCL1PPCAC_07913 [Pristionchus mayeri]